MGKGGDSSSGNRSSHLRAPSNDGRCLNVVILLKIHIDLLTRLVDLWTSSFGDHNDGRDLDYVNYLGTKLDDCSTRLDDLWTRLDDLNNRRYHAHLMILIDDLRTQLDDARNRLFAFVRDPERPSSKARLRLLEIVNWDTATWMATWIGLYAWMFYGGSKKAAAPVSKDAEVTLKLRSTPDKQDQCRLMRDDMKRRLIRVTHGSIIGGVCLGMFTAAFSVLKNLFAKKRVPGSPRWRLRNVLLGSILGAAFCFSDGWVHRKLLEKRK